MELNKLGKREPTNKRPPKIRKINSRTVLLLPSENQLNVYAEPEDSLATQGLRKHLPRPSCAVPVTCDTKENAEKLRGMALARGIIPKTN